MKKEVPTGLAVAVIVVVIAILGLGYVWWSQNSVSTRRYTPPANAQSGDSRSKAPIAQEMTLPD